MSKSKAIKKTVPYLWNISLCVFLSFISQLCTRSFISVKVYFSNIRTTLDELFELDYKK